jgi:hypothetical protein
MQHQIYFCNIQMKHMQQTFETHETSIVTCAHLLAAPQWTLIDTKLDVGTELDATARRSDFGCTQHESRQEARGAVDCSAREARAVRGARHKARVGARSTRRGGAREAQCAGAGGFVPSGWTDAW